MRGGTTVLTFSAILAVLASCSRAPFLYKPNKPLWPGHDAQAPLFPAAAAVQPLNDLTEPGASAPDLARAPQDSWPELSPADITRALAQELSQDGLVSSASVLDDPENDDELAARAKGARLFVLGEVTQASVEPDAAEGGEFTLALNLQVFARAAGDGEFNWRILDSTYRAQAALSQYGDPVAAENAALNQIFAQAAKDAANVLQSPDVAGKLGWTQP